MSAKKRNRRVRRKVREMMRKFRTNGVMNYRPEEDYSRVYGGRPKV